MTPKKPTVKKNIITNLNNLEYKWLPAGVMLVIEIKIFNLFNTK